ncbi:MAG: hypothetical protein KKC75_04355 [Nanoarchaeota archaeon]|nr:hypothetical protein [Nanoarchaeota archaeon]MBU1004583.1 hypothetical protein [Nanoarchaeota archaeon]MBU1946991.1 hypothetical protein [Nanoarchaeota archaeon]
MIKAFSPGNITCFFSIVENKNPLKKGSLGVSFAIDKGAIAEVSRSKKNVIIVNKVKKRFPTVETALGFLTKEPLNIVIKTQLPIGCGYGMSGACTLAALFAANGLLKLKKSRGLLALMAHRAEVINNTGLGTVTAEFLGGLLIRDRKGSPLSAKRLNIDTKVIYYRSFGPINTKKVITSKEMKKKINQYGLKSINKIKKDKKIKLAQLIKISKEFTEKAGLLKDKRVLKVISEVEKNKGAASMNMLGNSVFSSIPFEGCSKLRVSNVRAGILK